MAAAPKDNIPAAHGVQQSAGLSEQAALIAELAAVQSGKGFDAGGEAQFIEMLRDPLEIFRLLNPRDMPSSEQPDAAGASARIRGEIAAALTRPKLKKKGRAKAAAKPRRMRPPPELRAECAIEDIAVPFEPSEDDIAQALDGNGSSDNSYAAAWPMLAMSSVLCLIAVLTAIGIAFRLLS